MNWIEINSNTPRTKAAEAARGVLVHTSDYCGGTCSASICFIPDSRIENSDDRNPRIVARTETR